MHDSIRFAWGKNGIIFSSNIISQQIIIVVENTIGRYFQKAAGEKNVD